MGWSTVARVPVVGVDLGLLLEVSLADEPDAGTVDYLVAAGHALVYVLIAIRRHTDLFEWAQRDLPFSVSAEMVMSRSGRSGRHPLPEGPPGRTALTPRLVGLGEALLGLDVASTGTNGAHLAAR